MRRGPVYMIIAGLLLTIMFALVKVARTELDTLDVLFWRGVVAVPLSLVVAWPTGLRVRRPGLLVVRSAFGFAAMLSLTYAAKGLALADMGLLLRLQPIAVAIIAPLVLGRVERVSSTLWLLLAVSLAGVALILAPDLAVGSIYGVAALASGMFSACAHVSLRSLMHTDDARSLVFYFQLFMLMAAVLLIFMIYGRLPAVPSPGLIAPVLGIGALSMTGQLAMTYAYGKDRAAVVAAASYSSVVFGVIIDIIFFVVVPAWHVWIGGSLIVIAGIWLVSSQEPETEP